jgi:hypothetical protein
MTTLLSRSLQGFQKNIVVSNSKQRANARVAGQANVRLTPLSRRKQEKKRFSCLVCKVEFKLLCLMKAYINILIISYFLLLVVYIKIEIVYK